MIYLVGVDHKLQDGRSQPNSDDFVKYIRIVLKNRGITLLAEEWSADITNYRGESKLRNFENRVKYVAFDLLKDEQKRWGIKSQEEIYKESGGTEIKPGVFRGFDPQQAARLTREEAHKREPGWLKKLSPHLKNTKNTLLVCGSDHLSPTNLEGKSGFDKKLRDAGFEVEILACFFAGVG